MSRTFRFVTVDVFTDTRFGGNPLAVFPDARGLSNAEMQALAAEFNLSETTFVLPPEDPANTARVRIFNRTAEMPFAGHPNVGTGWVLAREGRAMNGVLRFEEIAGLVEVTVGQDGDCTIAAPRPLSLGPEMEPDLLASCVGLAATDVLVAAHRPVMASVGNSFVLAEVAPSALSRALPDLGRFRAAREAAPDVAAALGAARLPIYLYARDGARLRARMFSRSPGPSRIRRRAAPRRHWPRCCCLSPAMTRRRWT
ncbi:PhzF family phenazine biosynthesis protein [Roseomonas sp. CCTCC AB2023176]|uniref:PhzF family phenazine biosynthesis protein n=1 Tax=Roseomonas sp. CCTCC AB2023176 TaxID=3342640 RepID=UPI0035E3A56E